MTVLPPRTEDLPTILWGPGLGRDSDPVEVKRGRLIPGYDYSQREFTMLSNLVDDEETIKLYPLPTLKQLGRIAVVPPKGCWELPVYKDPKDRARYGSLRIAGLMTGASSLAHRTMYKVFYGADVLTNGPNDFLDHLCENKACCYPRHLEVVTPGINTMRGRQSDVAGQIAIEYIDSE